MSDSYQKKTSEIKILTCEGENPILKIHFLEIYVKYNENGNKKNSLN